MKIQKFYVGKRKRDGLYANAMLKLAPTEDIKQAMLYDEPQDDFNDCWDCVPVYKIGDSFVEKGTIVFIGLRDCAYMGRFDSSNCKHILIKGVYDLTRNVFDSEGKKGYIFKTDYIQTFFAEPAEFLVNEYKKKEAEANFGGNHSGLYGVGTSAVSTTYTNYNTKTLTEEVDKVANNLVDSLYESMKSGIDAMVSYLDELMMDIYEKEPIAAAKYFAESGKTPLISHDLEKGEITFTYKL